MGGHKGAHLALGLADAAAQQLDLIAAGVGIGHVLQGDVADALGGHLVGINVLAEGQGGQDADLAAGVVAVHVGGGVLLGIAVVLGLLQGLLKGQASADHPGEDIVGGAVEDAGDLGQLVGGQAGGEGPQDGDAATHAGLEEIAHAVLLGQLKQLIAVGGHQLLVRGDHALARLQGPGGKVQGDLGAADGLHHDVHLGVVLDDGEVLYKAILIGAVGEIPHVQDVFQAEQIVHPLVNETAVFRQHLGHAGAHSAKTQNRYVYHCIHLIVSVSCGQAVRPAAESRGLSGQYLALEHPGAGLGVPQDLLQRAAEGGGLRRHGDHGAAVGGDVLVDGEDVHARPGEHVQHAG